MKQLRIATRANADKIAEKLAEHGFIVERSFTGEFYLLTIQSIHAL